MGATFDSRWVPPVGGAPNGRTSTGGATTGLLSPVPEATQVLGTRESGSAPSGSQAKSSSAVNQQQAARQSQARRCRVEQAAGQVASRGDARAGKRARTGGAKASPGARSTDFHPTGRKRLRFLQGGRKFVLGLTDPPFRALRSLAYKNEICASRSQYRAVGVKLAAEINRVIPGWIPISWK